MLAEHNDVTAIESDEKKCKGKLKSDGKISIVKHNRAGRVMQMVVLLNDFEHAHSLIWKMEMIV